MSSSRWICNQCNQPFTTKRRYEDHNRTYHSLTRCHICNHECNNNENKDQHINICQIEYNKFLDKLNDFNNNNDLIQLVRQKFNTDEYADIYKLSYTLFCFDEVYPNSYFISSTVL
jgi:hypothetical protein